MTIRTELEVPLITFSQQRNIKVAWEGISFTPENKAYLQIFFLDKSITNPTLEFSSKRTEGMIQINVCAPREQSNKQIEELAEAVAALYPAANKQAFPTVSVERHPQLGRIMLDGNFRILPITVMYRQEL